MDSIILEVYIGIVKMLVKDIRNAGHENDVEDFLFLVCELLDEVVGRGGNAYCICGVPLCTLREVDQFQHQNHCIILNDLHFRLETSPFEL